MSSPVVTIALPIYDCERYLEATIKCILNQTFTDFEVVAILDGCTDRSEEILRQWADERFVIVRKEVNSGLVRSLNEIHRRARGKYIARFDQDDLYEPNRLTKQVEFLEANPDIDVLGSQFDYIDTEGNFAREARAFPLTHRKIKRDFQRYTAIGGPTCMYRLARIHAIGDYNEKYFYLEDVTLWLVCLAAGYKFANLPDILVHYRVHAQQTSTIYRERQLPQLCEVYAIYGPQIWGAHARPFAAKEPKISRLIRKVEDFVSR